MACFTKTKPRQRLPKCQETTTAGHRCKFNAVQYLNDRWVCRGHSGLICVNASAEKQRMAYYGGVFNASCAFTQVSSTFALAGEI